MAVHLLFDTDGSETTQFVEFTLGIGNLRRQPVRRVHRSVLCVSCVLSNRLGCLCICLSHLPHPCIGNIVLQGQLKLFDITVKQLDANIAAYAEMLETVAVLKSTRNSSRSVRFAILIGRGHPTVTITTGVYHLNVDRVILTFSHSLTSVCCCVCT